MTREQAIKMIKANLECAERDTSGQDETRNNCECDECSLNYERGNIGEQKEWLRMAIKALEQEACKDAISRRAVLAMSEYVGEMPTYENPHAKPEEVVRVKDILALPSVTPQPKSGKWIPLEYDGYADGNPVWDKWECSECRWEHSGDEESLTTFCPNCGAKMEVE